MPILLLSNEKEALKLASEVTPNVLYKNSSTLFSDLRDFMIYNFGFGNFIFKMPQGETIGEAGNVEELSKFFEEIPEESLDYHASKNHFSNWLAARGEFKLATQFRKIKGTDFKDIEERRNHHINLIKNAQKTRRIGSVAEFKPSAKSSQANFMRIGTGSLGGKARGLAFANSYLGRSDLLEKYPNINSRVPRVAVVCTDEFDQFMDVNNLWETALSLDDNKNLEEIFLQGRLSRK